MSSTVDQRPVKDPSGPYAPTAPRRSSPSESRLTASRASDTFAQHGLHRHERPGLRTARPTSRGGPGSVGHYGFRKASMDETRCNVRPVVSDVIPTDATLLMRLPGILRR